MFVKHIIKTLHVSVTIVWPFSGGRLSCLVLLLLLCLFASSSCLFGMWLYVVYVCACLMYLSVGCFLVHNTSLKPYTFQSQLFDHLQGAIFRAQCCYYFSACLRQVVYLVCGCMLSMCVCVPDVLICEMFGCEQPNIPQTSTSGTHTQTTYSHIPNKQLDDANKQRR